MNTVKGSIVKAVAGREKNGFFVVIHISPTGTVIEGSIKTNPQIRKILNNFRKSEG